MKTKTCRHCDIRFNRDDAAPIPNDRCERSHEEIEAMKRSAVCACGDIYPANSYGAGFMDGNNGVCENCDMADEHPLDRLAQAGLVRAAAKWQRGDMEAKRDPDGDSVSLSTKQHGENGNLSTSDPVNHPSHYNQGSIECIDAIGAATAGKRGIEAVCTANVIKYLWRYERKNGVEDVHKARWYLERLIKELEQ